MKIKNFCVRKAVSVYDLFRWEPVYKSEYYGNGQSGPRKKVGEEKVFLVEKGNLRDSLFLGRKPTSVVKPLWAIVRVRRARTGQLKLL